ncbi:MAG: DUF2059 domain-containing protein [Rudaea sp.]|uniref:DUF2059 domain-containing protein n=1 Tax=unclassified Rudaea TaxID=2627037 RepID=UPI0010F5AF47|nr:MULTISPECIES: DUF2059 domain-containing protein [unclassified Rudaea]MBN8885617.1 DUF2059 domain-containing protein [Rudaea sp.]MBR0345542.1 DUF2059 domain-containing protein [Rudaea sp.]
MLNKFLALVFVAVAPAVFGAEQNPAPTDNKTKLALELVQVVQFDKMMQSVQTQTRAIMEKQLESTAKCEAAKPIVGEFGGKTADLMTGVLSSNDFKVDVAAVYAEVFSEDELHQIIEFYQSPLGKKLLERMPQLTQKSMQIAQARVHAVTPELQKLGQSYGQKIAAACKSAASQSETK